MGTVRADNFSDGAGTGAPDFATGLKVSGGFDTSGDAGIATSSDPGLYKYSPFQSVLLTTDAYFSGTSLVNASGSGLVIGRKYLVLLQVMARTDSGSGRIRTSFRHPSAGTDQVQLTIDLITGVDKSGTTLGVFTATATTWDVNSIDESSTPSPRLRPRSSVQIIDLENFTVT